MLFYALTGLINGIISTFLGVFVYFKDRKEIINTTFVRFCLAVAIWSYGYFFWQISFNAEQALFWSRVLMFGSIFIPITFFHFVIRFLNIYQKEKKVLIIGYFLPPSFLFQILLL